MKPLEDILQDFNNIRDSYKNYCKNSSVTKTGLIEFETRFTELKSDMTYWKSKLSGDWSRYDDKAATAIKYRIAVEIYRKGFIDTNGDVYEKTSLSSAEKLAAATERYTTFINDRAFYKESMVNISDTKDDINSYINLIKDQLK